MINEFASNLFDLGMKPIPLVWNVTDKTANSHVIAHSKITADNWNKSDFAKATNGLTDINGMGIKLFPPFGMVDFDLKNTDDKDIYSKWMQAISAQDDDIISKICIEETRNKGYHVYIKYSKLKSKVSLAKEVGGDEVIAIYTGGVLAYCDPTPGYNIIHNEFQDLEELTDDQFDIIVSSAQAFNKHEERYFDQDNKDNKDPNGRVIINYPTEYENLCHQFDRNITDEVFEDLLNQMTLHEIKDYRYHKKDRYIAYLREGSSAKYSAKVYWNSRRVLLFTSSITGYPSYMDRVNNDYSWVLTPSRILFYKNDRDWITTIEEIKLISDSADIEIIEQASVTDQEIIAPDRLKFPIDIFPKSVGDFILSQRIQQEYVAAAALGAISTMTGNNIELMASDTYKVKAIIYLAIVAPPGASKTPAIKSIFAPIEAIDSASYKQHKNKLEQYKKDLGEFKNQKKGEGIQEPIKPEMTQILIKDSTIEMLIKILGINEDGCCLLADELSGFLKRMGRYGDNDEVQKWLELWSGSPILMQRLTREEDKVENPYCSIVGGIQPGVLESLSSKENEHNGFYHRFLFCYPDAQEKGAWVQHTIPVEIKDAYIRFINEMDFRRKLKTQYRLSLEANDLYGEWFNNKNTKYNKATHDHIKGIIAKYQDYCLRFSLMIQTSNDADTGAYNNLIDRISMEKAIRLTEYFFGNMNKAINILAPENPKDKLTGVHKKFYEALPQTFSPDVASHTAATLSIKAATSRSILKRWCENKDPLLTKAGERKEAIYEKIY